MNYRAEIINYRAEIDGLRALAVFGVIVYHSKFSIFGLQVLQGGFYGVDIFFVISGYLITKIIVLEYINKEKFSYINFYERRMRRILPLLFFILLLTVFIGYYLLLPSAYIDFSKSLISSTFFSSNIFFYISNQAYDAVNSLAIPLLHTWSLSVEEQFYIFFPFMMIFLFKRFENKITTILIIISILSLVFAIFGSYLFDDLNFYILPSRLWELLSGSLYFFYEKNYKNKNKSQIDKFFPSIGLFLISFSFIFINDKVFHPSLITIIPITGTILILNYAAKGELVTNILSSKLFVAFGLISYSLYLWHYPIFAFSRIHLLGSNNFYVQLLVFLSVILLSVFTYFFIEKPFRNKEFIKRKLFFLIIASTAILLLVISLKIINSGGLKARVKKIDNYEFDNKLLGQKANYYTNKYSRKITFSNNKSEKILIIGDSNAGGLFNIFHQNQNLFQDKEFRKIYPKDLFSDSISKKLLLDSDIILISFNWKSSKREAKEFRARGAEMAVTITSIAHKDEDLLKKINKFSVKNEKKLIIVLKRPIFSFMDNGMTPLDNYLFRNRTQKVDWEMIKRDYSKKYFQMIIENKKINKFLIIFSKTNNITLFCFTCDS